MGEAQATGRSRQRSSASVPDLPLKGVSNGLPTT